jgi:hypothetical protein
MKLAIAEINKALIGLNLRMNIRNDKVPGKTVLRNIPK